MRIKDIIKNLEEEIKNRGNIELKLCGGDIKDYGHYEFWDNFKIISCDELDVSKDGKVTKVGQYYVLFGCDKIGEL